MNIGIDKFGLAIPEFFLDIRDLAVARNENANKFLKGLLQLEMSVSPVTQDIVTLGATAAHEFLTEEDKKKIDMVIIGTETGVDQSKSASVFIHNLLGIQPFARCIEIKEACYGATAGLDFAKKHIENNPDSYVLLIASDIAKYGIGTSGESTQGSGSCAMLIKKDPNILILNNDNVCQTRDIMDFWRPNYSAFPYVDGHFSTKQYLECLETTWAEYCRRTGKKLEDFTAFCFHLPFPKLGLKGLNSLFDKNLDREVKDNLLENFHTSITYSRRIGNIYTGSLYLGLLSLLENSNTLKPDDNIAFFSYGSGAVCEIFTGTLAKNFKKNVNSQRLESFQNRKKLSVSEYEKMFFGEIIVDKEGNCSFEPDESLFSLEKIENHKRIYKKNCE